MIGRTPFLAFQTFRAAKQSFVRLPALSDSDVSGGFCGPPAVGEVFFGTTPCARSWDRNPL